MIMRRLIILIIISAICCISIPISAAEDKLVTADYLILRGTLFTSSNRPVAMIEDTRTSVVSMCEIGETYNSLYVEKITRGEVVLSSPSGKINLSLPSGAVMSINEGFSDNEIWYNVRKDGDTYIIDADTITAAISRAKEIMRNVKIGPCFQKGILAGIKFSKFKPVGILKEIGVAEGDVVKSVNGFKITSPFQVYKVCDKVRHESQINVEVLRDNQPLILNYRITK